MNVAFTDIPTPGLDIALGPWAAAACAAGLGGEVKAFDGALTLTRHGVHIAARGELHLVGDLPCDRCGEPLVVSLGGDVSIVYSPMAALPESTDDEDGLPQPPVDVGFSVDDVGEFDGVTLDLVAVVREWAMVERPSRLTCGQPDDADDEACQARFRALAGAQNTPTSFGWRAPLLSLNLPSED